jgi:LuxR family maltose regulon positive regulatory protein
LLFSEDLEGGTLGRIRLAIHVGELGKAKALLHEQYSNQRGRTFRQIKLAILEAQLHDRQGSHNLALRCLFSALRLAGPGNYLRCFLDEGDAVLGMLRRAHQSLPGETSGISDLGAERRLLENLLSASGIDANCGDVQLNPDSFEPLTDQERKILVMLAGGASNREMAARIFVSENTIKFHLKHIYAKLLVANRAQAVATARNHGLVR